MWHASSVKYIYLLFGKYICYLLFGYHMASFSNHYQGDGLTHQILVVVFYQVLTQRSLGAMQGSCFPKSSNAPCGVWARSILICTQPIKLLTNSFFDSLSTQIENFRIFTWERVGFCCSVKLLCVKCDFATLL